MSERAATPSIIMLGPALSVRGGVSAVERVLIDSMATQLAIEHVPTMIEGSKWTKMRQYLRALWRVWRTLRADDVVHLHFASGASSRRKMMLARLGLGRGAHVILHHHGGGYRRYWERMSALERRWTLQTLQRVDGIIVLGRTWRDFFVSLGVPPENVVILPNPVSLPQLPPQRTDQSVVTFLYLGLIAPLKGTFDLLEAVARLSPEIGARVRVVIAGNGALAQLRERADALQLSERVEIRDWVDAAERDRLLATADAFVLPSYAEGLPMAMLEAMAWELPSIVTPVGSITEYVIDGDNGLLVQPGAWDELAAAMTRLVADAALRRRMGQHARAAVASLDATLYVSKMAMLYRSVAAQAPLLQCGG